MWWWWWHRGAVLSDSTLPPTNECQEKTQIAKEGRKNRLPNKAAYVEYKGLGPPKVAIGGPQGHVLLALRCFTVFFDVFDVFYCVFDVFPKFPKVIIPLRTL